MLQVYYLPVPCQASFQMAARARNRVKQRHQMQEEEEEDVGTLFAGQEDGKEVTSSCNLKPY